MAALDKTFCVIPCWGLRYLDSLPAAVASARRLGLRVIVTTGDRPARRLVQRMRQADDGVFFRALPPSYRHGVGAARNAAIHAAPADAFIVPLDADDVLLPGILTLIEGAQSGELWYGGWAEIKDGSTRDVMPRAVGMLGREPIARTTCVYARTDWLRVGGYPPEVEMGLEHWAFMRMMESGGVVLRPQNLVTFRYELRHSQRAARAHSLQPELAKMVEQICQPDWYKVRSDVP